MSASLADYHWLTSDAAEPFLRCAGEHTGETTRLVKALRKQLSAERAHVVIEQVELRKRAREKFSRAEEMFFTRKGLEQATDERIAAYKAQLYRSTPGVVLDICCGIGGDLIVLGCLEQPTHVYGIDSDPVISHFAQENCRRMFGCRAEVITQYAEEAAIASCSAWHVDPDRRADGQRVTRLEFVAPGQPLIDSWRVENAAGGIKLAPATEVPELWEQESQREWIGSRGECRQQMAWFGPLAFGIIGRRCATIVDAAAVPRRVIEHPDAVLQHVTSVGRYIYESHGAVLAARLAASLAAEHGLHSLTAEGGYLTGDRRIVDGALSAFEVHDVLPFDMKRLKAYFREQHVGRLEVKIRGVDGAPDPIRKRLELRGNEERTLLIARTAGGILAIVAQRLH